MSKKIILTLIKTVLPLLIGVYLFWYFFTSMSTESKEQFYNALKSANYFWIILSVTLGVVAYFSRAHRWKYVLEPLGFETKFWNRYHAIMIGYLINLTIPRAGEASRSAMLYRSDGVPFTSSFGTIIGERAIDFVLLCSIATLTILVGHHDFNLIFQQIETQFGFKGFPWQKLLYIAILGGVVMLALLVFIKNKFTAKVRKFTKEIFAGVFSIFKSKNPFAYILHTLIIWGCYVSMFWVCFFALNETGSIPFSGILIGFIAGALGITFTNGGIGSYPLLVGLVVAFYIGQTEGENAQAIGNALGMLIWVSQTVLMILLGLLSLVLLPKNYSKHDQTGIPQK